jgi:hypothetical protein
MAVPVKAGTTFEPGTPHALFDTELPAAQYLPQYSVSGQSAVPTGCSNREASSSAIVVQNWTLALKK